MIVGVGIVMVVWVTPAHEQALEYRAGSVHDAAVLRLAMACVTVVVPVVEGIVTMESVTVFVATIVLIVVVPVVVVVLSVKNSVSMSVWVLTTGDMVMFRMDVAKTVEVTVVGKRVVANKLEQLSRSVETAEAQLSLHVEGAVLVVKGEEVLWGVGATYVGAIAVVL